MKKSTVDILKFIWNGLAFAIAYYLHNIYGIGLWEYVLIVAPLLIIGDLLGKRFIEKKK
jgi:uncharacterized membrane protein YfcA